MNDLLEEAEELLAHRKNTTVRQLEVCAQEMVAEIYRLRECCEKYGKKVMQRESSMLKVITRNREQRKQLIAKDSLNYDLMANCNQLRDRCWKAESELAIWRQIAIEERARVLYFAHAGDDMYDMACLEESDHHKERHIREAAKELQLEATEETSYLARLEASFLKMYPLYTGATDDRAQAALDMIREGNGQTASLLH